MDFIVIVNIFYLTMIEYLYDIRVQIRAFT